MSFTSSSAPNQVLLPLIETSTDARRLGGCRRLGSERRPVAVSRRARRAHLVSRAAPDPTHERVSQSMKAKACALGPGWAGSCRCSDPMSEVSRANARAEEAEGPGGKDTDQASAACVVEHLENNSPIRARRERARTNCDVRKRRQWMSCFAQVRAAGMRAAWAAAASAALFQVQDEVKRPRDIRGVILHQQKKNSRFRLETGSNGRRRLGRERGREITEEGRERSGGGRGRERKRARENYL